MNQLVKLFIIVFISLLSFVSAETVNINTANAETMAQYLKGIGEVKAKAIIEYREKNGNFIAIEELLNVPGIGQKTLDQIQEQIILDDEEGLDEEDRSL